MRNLVLNVKWLPYYHAVKEQLCDQDEVLRAQYSAYAQGTHSPSKEKNSRVTPWVLFYALILLLSVIYFTLLPGSVSAQTMATGIATPARDAYGRPLRPPRLVMPEYIDREVLSPRATPHHHGPSNIPRAPSHRQQFRAVVFPVVGIRKSSDYGMRVHPILKFSRMHTGVDLAAPEGSFVRGVQAGTVVFADPYAGYGNLVVIAHGNKVTTHYGHLEKILVRTGKRVKAGDIIATVGSTGHSTGPHLHFEVRIDGTPKNPELFLQGIGAQAEG